MSKLIECVPNFSEGRNIEVLDAIRDSITCVKDAELWDQSADTDHNRSVFTLAGTPAALTEAALNFTEAAIRRIDMSAHTGVHPCIGAADVIPFIPLRDCGMSDCIALAEQVGKKLAKAFNMPIYLYAQAARTPAHRRLADIRRGGWQTLREVIDKDSKRFPDFGPCSLPIYGGASVGARDFLVAFNIYLETDDTAIAKRIARHIRESSGGFPALQAIGLNVKGMAQVSMNLLDYRRTSMCSIVSTVRELAAAEGCALAYTELIGLLPAAALNGSSAEELLIRDFTAERIIENHYH